MEPLKAKGWAIKEDTETEGGIRIPVIHARVVFDKTATREVMTNQLDEIYAELIKFFGTKKISVRFGAWGFAWEENEPYVLFTIEQSQFSRLQEAVKEFPLILGG